MAKSSPLTFFPDSDCAGDLANGQRTVSYDHLCPAEIQLKSTQPLSFLDQFSFLWESPTSGQFELQPNKLVLNQVAVVTGDIDLTGEPATIQVEAQENQLGGVHGDYGYTFRDVWSGRYFYVVNGGHPIRLRFTAVDVGPSSGADYLPVDRVVNPAPGTFTTIPTVTMVSGAPPILSPVTPSDPNWAQVDSATEEDSSGQRSATVFIPANTDWLVNGVPLTPASGWLEAGVQEYTVGDGEAGAQRMPAELPAASAYTYAAELVALLEGSRIDPTFSQPVYVYVDNFLDFPVGHTVPNGTYDRDAGVWVQHTDGGETPLPLNGKVVKFVDIDNKGCMRVDTTGDGEDDNNDITEEECLALAGRYQEDVGKTFWRMPVTHFSAWDFNLGWTPPLNAKKPPPPEEDDENGLSPDSCVMSGSTIECESRVLGEQIPIEATPYSLVYRSSRVPGYKPAHRRTLKIPGNGQNVLPDSAKKLVADLEVAGVKIHQEKNKPSGGWGLDESFTFDWNGKDAFGRDLNGVQIATVHVGAVYQGVYGKTDGFNLPPADQYQTNDTRQEVTYWTTWHGTIGFLDARAFGNGGWTISHQHFYDRNTETIHYGDGRWRRAPALGQVLVHECEGCNNIGYYPYGMDFDPNGVLYFIDRTGGPSGVGTLKKLENGVVTNVMSVLGGPTDVRVAPNGTIYVAQPAVGIVSKLVGMQLEAVNINPTFNINIPLSQPSGIALAPDGTLFISDTGGHRIWRVAADGSSMTAFAGNGTAGSSGDEGLAIDAQLRAPLGIDVADDGSVFFVDLNGVNGVEGSIRRVDPAGIIHLVAGGDGNTNDSSEGILATTAKLNAPQNVRIGSDGNAYFTEGTGTNGHGGRVRKITSIGRIVTVAGDGLSQGGLQCDDGPATTVHLVAAQGLVFAPDGSLWVSQHGNNTCDALRRLVPAVPGAAVGTQLVPSEDASEVYEFNEFGRHVTTYDAVLGTTKFEFVYSPYQTYDGHFEQLLSEIKDLRGSEGAQGLSTFFDRTPAGELELIRSPFYASGGATTDTPIENGWLIAVNGPTAQYGLEYKPQALEGLLETLTDPKGGAHTFTYDADGRLETDRDPKTQISSGSAPFRSLTYVQDVTGGYVTGGGVEITTAKGLKHKFGQTVLPPDHPTAPNVAIRTVKRPGATGVVQAALSRESGARLAMYPDGSSRLALLEPDPRFGLAAGTTHETLELPTGKKLAVNVDRDVVGAVVGSPFTFTSLSETRSVYPDPADPNTKIQYTSTFYRTESPPRIATTSPVGRSVSQYLDSHGRVFKERSGPGTSEVADILYHWDAYGRLETVDQGNRRVKYLYDPDTGFLQTVSVGTTSNAWLLQTTFVRNAAGDVIQATDYQSFSTVFDRDEMGAAWRIRTQAGTGGSPSYYDHNQPPDIVGLLDYYTPPPVAGEPAGTVGYDYDLDRRPTSVDAADGRSLAPTYDQTSGKLTEIRDETNQVLRQFAYNPTTGNITSASSNGVTTSFGYDAFGAIADRVTTTWSGAPAEDVTFEYDGYLRPNKEKVTGAPDVTYTLDDDGLVTTAAISSPVITFHLDDRSIQSGRLNNTSIGFVATAIHYDPTYADVTQVATTFNGSSNRYEINFDADEIGRVQTKIEQVQDDPNTVETYEYWPAGWLKSVDDGTTTTQWEYDPRGNRTKEDGVQIATYDARDRILTYNTASTGSLSFHYDADGRRDERKLSGTPTHNYTWDRFGLLESVTTGTTFIQYTSDALGRRVTRKKYVGGVLQSEERYLYSGDNRLVATLNGSGTVTARFIYASGSHTPDLMVRGGTVYRIVTDQLGSPRAVINVANGNQDVYKHDVWGKETTAPAVRIPFGFAGGLYDAETKLVHFGARDYDPEVGRWISPDPIRFDGGTNLYAYANGDPVNYVDHTGRSPLLVVTVGLGIIAGAGLDLAHQLANNGQSFNCVDWGEVALWGAVGAVAGVELGVALSVEVAAGGLAIQTPYALEVQSLSAEAEAALLEVRSGATVFRTGELGESMAGESQYWSLTNPLSPGYAGQMGVPGVTPNFIMGGTVSRGASVLTNEAAALGGNAGGGVQVVTSPGGVSGLWFHMP